MKPILLFLLSILFTLGMNSCSPQNIFESDINTKKDTSFISLKEKYEHAIKMDDKITVSIWNHDDLSVGSLFGVYNSNEVYGKWVLVDLHGEVSLPQIGRVKLSGLCRSEAEQTLTKLYAEYIVNPVVVVKVINREVTVLGEVKNAGNYTLDKESNTVLEMLGRAGGTDFYANKKKIQVIRGTGKNIHHFTLDLTNLQEYRKNNFNLEGGDVVLVPSRKSKMLDKKAPVIIPFVSLLTGLIVLLKFIGQ